MLTKPVRYISVLCGHLFCDLCCYFSLAITLVINHFGILTLKVFYSICEPMLTNVRPIEALF